MALSHTTQRPLSTKAGAAERSAVHRRQREQGAEYLGCPSHVTTRGDAREPLQSQGRQTASTAIVGPGGHRAGLELGCR
jgi:hypothetical protein